MSDSTGCDHIWISNSGQGGTPIFKEGTGPYANTMHVACAKCNARTWFTREQWFAMEEHD